VGAAGAVLYQQGAFASLTRVFLVGPNPFVRGLTGMRKWRAAGPVSVLLFFFGLIAAIVAAVRSVLVKRVKSCKCCKGYGIVRCRLCNGDGAVEWSGEWAGWLVWGAGTAVGSTGSTQDLICRS
jgi:hypothetical protein